MDDLRAAGATTFPDRMAATPDPAAALSLALVTETYPDDVNGVAMTLGRLVAGLRHAGHRVQVVRSEPAGGRPSDQGGRNGHPTFLFRPGFALPMYPEVRIGAFSRQALVAAWRQWRPDVVHVATEGPLGLSAIYAARELDLPVTTTFHTNLHTYTRHYHLGFLEPVAYGYLRWFHNRTSCTLVPTAAQATELAAHGFERVGVLSRGIDTDLFTPARRDPGLRAEWGVGDDDLALICVGRVAAEKNLELALRCLEAMRTERPGTRLVLVGDGPMRDAVRDRPGVVSCGMRYGEDLARHYASADLLLFPSLTETYGNVLIEGMAAGLPTVSFRYAAAAERVSDGDNGIAVPFGDAEAYVAAVCDLAGREPAERQALGARARESVLPISWRGVVEDFVGHLRGACGRRRSVPCAAC